jgi:hypothetical protein
MRDHSSDGWSFPHPIGERPQGRRVSADRVRRFLRPSRSLVASAEPAERGPAFPGFSGSDRLRLAGRVEQRDQRRAKQMLVVIGHRCSLGRCAGGEEQGKQKMERGPSHPHDITSPVNRRTPGGKRRIGLANRDVINWCGAAHRACDPLRRTLTRLVRRWASLSNEEVSPWTASSPAVSASPSF